MNHSFRWIRAVFAFIFLLLPSLFLASCQSETESTKPSISTNFESSEIDTSKKSDGDNISEIMTEIGAEVEAEAEITIELDLFAVKDELDALDVAMDTELRAKIAPQEGDEADFLWAKFLYAWGYGFDDLVTECLDAYEAAGQDYDIVLANAARQFLSQANSLGYDTGCAICFFEDFKDHPTLLVGDIIVAVDNQPVSSADDISNIKAASGTDSWDYTVLRPDENGILLRCMSLYRNRTRLQAIVKSNLRPLNRIISDLYNNRHQSSFLCENESRRLLFTL